MTYDINALETLDDREELAATLLAAGVIYEYEAEELETYQLEALLAEHNQGIRFGFDY